MDTAMIKITVSDEGIPQVWDSADWLTLRKKYRIIGNLSGVLYDFPLQEQSGGLPFVLYPYEATLLCEKNIAQLVRYPSLSRAPGKGVKEVYEKYRQKLISEQMICLLGKAPQLDAENTQIEQKSNQFRRKTSLKECMPSKEIAACDSSCDPRAGCIFLQTFTMYPWLRAEDACCVKWKYPSTDLDVVRFNVFKELWEKGYYISSGQRFGGDFLVYPGDPFTTYAHFLIVCIDKSGVLRPVDIAMLTRLGNSLKKSVILASETNNQIIYQTLQCSNLSK